MADTVAPRLISIESVRWSAYGPGTAQANYWKVVLGTDDGRGNTMLTATFHIERKNFADDQVLAVARNYVARLCRGIADETADWVMSDEQFQAAKIGATAAAADGPPPNGSA